MKYIAFSFDDARLDTYTNAFQILKEYDYSATINVTTDFIMNPSAYTQFASAGNKPMTVNQLHECHQYGIEIAGHGHNHVNNKEDCLEGLHNLSNWGFPIQEIGFASPGSELTKENMNENGIGDLLDRGILSYIRSGIRIRREGLYYTILSAMDMFIHSKMLFWNLNKRNIFFDDPDFVTSVSIYSYTTLKQLVYMLNKMKDNQKVILMFHSILSQDSPYYGTDKYFWDASCFRNLLDFIKQNGDIEVLNTKELLQK